MPLSLPHTQLPPVHQNDSHSPPSYNMQLSHTHVHTRRPQTPRSPSHNSRTSSFFPFPTIRTAALPLGVCWQLLRAPPLPAAPGPNASCPLRPEARTTAPGQTPAAAPPLPRAQPMHVRGPGSPAPPAPSSLRSAPLPALPSRDRVREQHPARVAPARSSPPAGGRRRRRRGLELGTARQRPGLRGTSPLPEAGAQQALPARRPHASRPPPPRRAQGPTAPQRPLLSPSAPPPFAGPEKPRPRARPRPRYLSAKERRRPPAFGRRAARLGPDPP